MSENTYLAHYGVKGMKWGVRKDRVTKAKGSRSNSKGGFHVKSETVATAAKIGITVVAATISGGLGGAMASTVLNNEIIIGAATSAVNAAITAIGHQGVDVAHQHAKRKAVEYITKKQTKAAITAVARPFSFEGATDVGVKAGNRAYKAIKKREERDDA